MTDKHRLNRRDFLNGSAAALAAGLAGGLAGRAEAGQNEAIQEAAARVGPLPRRKLGNKGKTLNENEAGGQKEGEKL